MGREGSDFTAAVLAHVLDAESVTVWKDVPGILNADPKWYNAPVLLSEMTYREAIELTFYGASIIHPKTLKPLQNKNIPLYVKSFLSPANSGTKVAGDAQNDYTTPVFIRKSDQVLLSFAPSNFSILVESNLKEIFDFFTTLRVKVNLMQNSALSFSVCINYDSRRFNQLIQKLKENYRVTYNNNVELITIRHYTESLIQQFTEDKEILMEQKSRSTVSLVMK